MGRFCFYTPPPPLLFPADLTESSPHSIIYLQVWTFVISGAEFKLFPTLGGTKRDGEELNIDKIKMVLVDSKIASA